MPFGFFYILVNKVYFFVDHFWKNLILIWEIFLIIFLLIKFEYVDF